MRREAGERGLGIYLVILVLTTIVNSILARLGVIARPIGPASSGLYFSVAFMIVFALWFGAWGVIAAYAGCYIGAGILGGMPHGVNLYWSVADIWQVLIPLLAFRGLKADVSLRTKRDFLIFLVFGWALNNVIGASWGAATLAIGGLSAWNEVPGVLIGWLTGNLIVTMAITPLLLRFATPYIQRAGLYVRGYWS